MHTIRIWDLPTRLFHWALAACFLGLVVTGNVGGNAMVWHFRMGYTVLSLLLFRLVWGFVGGYWSRWSQLPIRPKRVWSYVFEPSGRFPSAGHNPLGSLSIIALLGVLGLQVATGLVSDDEIANTGPFSALVSNALVSWATSWHQTYGKSILLAMVAMHLLALLWYRWKKNERLVLAMFQGDKILPEVHPDSVDNVKTKALGLVVFLMAIGAVAFALSFGG